MKIGRLRCPPSLALERVEMEELLDRGAGSARDVADNLAEMQRINDLLGGTRALTRHLYPRLEQHAHPLTLLDLGTGGGGLPARVAAWARRHRRLVNILAVDWSARNLAAAGPRLRSYPEILPIRADALHLPLPPGAADYVISTLFLHHFPPEQVVQLLRRAFQTARRGIIMSDLVRGHFPLAAFQLVAPVFARNYLTYHDGLLSVRRAYTVPELLELARCAGLPDPRVYAHFPWRMTLVVEK